MKGHGWYNFRKKEYEFIETAPEDYVDYIPQFPSSINLYNLLVEQGVAPINAAMHIYEILTGGIGEIKGLTEGNGDDSKKS